MSSKEGSLARLNVTRIPYLNTLVIKQVGGRFFISTQDSIVMSDLLSYRVLEGILDEYKRSKGQ
jgi:hypothetical protein